MIRKWRKKVKSSSKKPVRYEEEKMHIVRVILLCLITTGFFASAALSIYTVLKTKEIVQHPGIYRKQRDYSCSEETDDREALTTGTMQLLTFDSELLPSIEKHLSQELNPNPQFKDDNVNEPELPVGYRYTDVGSARGQYLHNKMRNTLDTFSIIPSDGVGQSGWFMEYIPVTEGTFYLFQTTYELDAEVAHIIAEEVDGSDARTYTDVKVLSRTDGKVDLKLLYIPKKTTTKLRFFTQLNSTGSLSISQESVRGLTGVSFKEPLVSLSFDDGWNSVYKNGKPILDKHGVKTSQYIIAESFRNVLSGYMSLSEVQQLSQEGHEIASHSLRHCNLARLAEEDLTYDITASKSTLETEFPDIKGLAYPYGSFNETVKKIASKNYGYVRTTENGYNVTVSDIDELRAVTVRQDIPIEEFKQLVDFAIDHNLWLNLIYHKVEENPDLYGVTPAMLDEQISYLKSRGIRIVPVKDAVDQLTDQRKEAL